MSNAKRYTCGNCGRVFQLSGEVGFCPACGSPCVTANSASAAHAAEMVSRMRELVPLLEKSWAEYVRLRAEYDNIRMVSGAYVSRGIIKKSDIPVVRKIKLSDALREYRERRNASC